MSKGRKVRLIIFILLIVIISIYVSTHAKRKLIIKENILVGVREGIFESRLSMRELIIPTGVKVVNEYAFIAYENLETVKLPDTLESIGKFSFAGCRKIEYINIPDNVKEIGEGAFYKCSNKKI